MRRRRGNEGGYSAAGIDFNRLNSSPTRLLRCFNHSISDGVKGKFTGEKSRLDVGETVEPVTEVVLPEVFEGLAMLVP